MLPLARSLLTLATALCLGAGAIAASRDDAAGDAGSGAGAEGFWIARTPSGVAVKWGILDGGETWGIYESEGTILGAFHGTTHAAAGALHGTGRAFDIPSRTVGAASYTGTYFPRQAITITTSFGASFEGRYAPSYEQPASLAALAGRYDGEGLSSRSEVQGMALRFADDGALSGHAGEGCRASGRALPRPGGRNVFNLSLRFEGPACALGDGTSVAGIAHVDAASGELFLLATDAAKTDGWLYLGQRAAD
jgi:hypothetical protein